MGTLDTAFGFGPEDLVANREGRIGPRQRAMLLASGGRVAGRRRPTLRLGVALLAVGIPVAVAGLLVGNDPGRALAAAGGVLAVFGISLVGSAWTLRTEPRVMARLAEGPVEWVEGPVRLTRRHDRFVGTRHMVVADGTWFHVLPTQQTAFTAGDVYRIYYVRDRGARRVVAAERLAPVRP